MTTLADHPRRTATFLWLSHSAGQTPDARVYLDKNQNEEKDDIDCFDESSQFQKRTQTASVSPAARQLHPPCLQMPIFSPYRKRLREESEDDIQDMTIRSERGMDCEDEHEEYDDGEELSQGKEGLIPPHVMLEHVESFRKFATERGKLSLPWSRMKTLFDEWIVLRQQESQVSDPENVSDYLDRPESVLMHADYPVKPPSLINIYCKKFGCTAGFGKMKKAFLEKLEEFLTNNSDVLRPKQKQFVQNKVKLIRKKLFPSQRASKAKAAKQVNGKVARQEMTAFDLFCQTKKDKYTDLPEEDRVRKLQKKFNKLPEDKREIFEKLALGSVSAELPSRTGTWLVEQLL
ncbi:hypothetical protein ANCDUO_14245 [Ancylostoma duodenale]|uniref:Uncharacterized protein n=1 Tax=Ancylostoma duodenale TaxID=51022 RepID=A0A0C2G9N2_9BILA|nr:hypothetical protein ANCDUO_14245 [Ancylostoma duodenale]